MCRWLMRVMLLGALSSAAVAQATQVTGEALRQMVSGNTIVLNTPMGGLPITFREDGRMSAEAPHLAKYTGQASDSGRWWLSADQLCQQWNTWLERRSYCYAVRLVGKTVHWRRNDGTSGTATIALR